MRSLRLGLAAGAVLLGGMAMGVADARADMNAEVLLERKGCLTCHSLLGKGGRMGPPLQSTAAWSDAERMRQYIKDPKSVNPKSIMPRSRVTDAELDAVVEYLQSFKGEAKAPEGWKPK